MQEVHEVHVRDYFSSARDEAFDFISRFFNASRRQGPSGRIDVSELWLVELEVSNGERILVIPISVFIMKDFPLSMPYIHVDKQTIELLEHPPHISMTGEICTYDRNTSIPDPRQPGLVVRECLIRARDIIEDCLTSQDQSRYESEFIAYWELQYGEEDPITKNILSLIPDNGPPPSKVTYVQLHNQIGLFQGLIYSETDQLHPLSRYLEAPSSSAKHIETFHLGVQGDIYPPFDMTNADVRRIAEQSNRLQDFDAYLRSRPLLPLVTFTKVLDGRTVVFGWEHQVTKLFERPASSSKQKLKKRRLKASQLHRILDDSNSPLLVKRFSPQVYTRDRIERRTGDSNDLERKAERYTILLAGLGSVGSNLVPFLAASGVTDFHLVDPDRLALHNIGRHLAGLSHVGIQKTAAMRLILLEKNPLLNVEVRDRRIIEVIQEDPEFVISCDYHFFCTGEINTETWIATNMVGSNWSCPSFFIWVEPFLAGGHCIFFDGHSKLDWEGLHDRGRYVHNVIHNAVLEATNFAQQEKGCQISYLPFGYANLMKFLGAIYPRIDTLLKLGGDNQAITWVGDLNYLREKGIRISSFAIESGPFNIITRPI